MGCVGSTRGRRWLPSLNATTGCPLAWREKIVEWCYQMERIILQGLNWYLTPATPHLFLEIFFETSQDNEAMNEIKDSASYLLELAVCDNFFITKKASSISRAAILAAMDIVARPLEVNVLLENLLVDDDRCVVEKCYTRLLQIYNMIVKQDDDGVPQEVIAEREVSPTSVFSVA
eukprot:scaffold16716_cov146-Skeletonema_dohrnii-CCMP3373.AAC.24